MLGLCAYPDVPPAPDRCRVTLPDCQAVVAGFHQRRGRNRQIAIVVAAEPCRDGHFPLDVGAAYKAPPGIPRPTHVNPFVVIRQVLNT
jgi:hypothetical protein